MYLFKNDLVNYAIFVDHFLFGNTDRCVTQKSLEEYKEHSECLKSVPTPLIVLWSQINDVYYHMTLIQNTSSL